VEDATMGRGYWYAWCYACGVGDREAGVVADAN